MFHVLCRSSGRCWGAHADPRGDPARVPVAGPLAFQMRENRSPLTQQQSLCITAIAVMMMVASLLPAIRGFWPTALFMLLATGGTVFALERHRPSRPASETLELEDGRVRHVDGLGRQRELTAYWVTFSAEARTPYDLRLLLRSREGTIEFGRCLSVEERRAIAPLIAQALAHARGC